MEETKFVDSLEKIMKDLHSEEDAFMREIYCREKRIRIIKLKMSILNNIIDILKRDSNRRIVIPNPQCMEDLANVLEWLQTTGLGIKVTYEDKKVAEDLETPVVYIEFDNLAKESEINEPN